MWKDVKEYVRQCTICKRYKLGLVASLGLLQPLPIPQKIFSDITMDFIEGLSKSNGKSIIFKVVDKLTKYAHFMLLSHPYIVVTVAQKLLGNVYKLHGLPTTIIND